VLLDGAHNPAGAAALAVALDDLAPHLRPAGAPTLVLATMGDKDVPGIVSALARAEMLAGAAVICTRVDAPRALEPGELADAWRAASPRATEPLVEPDPQAAVDHALSRARGPVIVAGSLYLVGAVRAQLIDDPLLRDPLP
jgi:dihydrofolate synthase/folylpolyglutamate synthase